MKWIGELYDLYERNRELAGKAERGRFGEPLILLPVFHTTVAAQITVTVDTDGNFLGAERVAEEDKLTVIPVTEKSASPALHTKRCRQNAPCSGAEPSPASS